VISVGTKLSGSLRQRFEASFPASSLYEYYGSSELGYVTLLAPRDAREAPETIGTPFPGVEVAFFDEKGQPVPPGKPGKLFVRSPQTFEGFIDQEQNAVSFQGEWVTSHDIGFVRREDGRIMLLGRDRDVIKAGGSLVYALEVETVLMSIEGVKEAAVIPGPDPVRGEAVWAAVSLEKGAVLANVQKALRRRLSPSKRPRKWRVFAELPKNRNGKIDKPRIALSMLSDS
jgi:long-chain acyl-CoA synthetase